MLQKMRDQTQSTAFKVLVGIIVVVLVVFGFGAFNLFVTGDPEVASVNGDGITQSALAQETERERRRLAANLGENFDPSLIDPVRLQNVVLDRLVSRKLLGQAADDLGVAVGRTQVDEAVVAIPAFQIDGRFNQDVYVQSVRSMGFTPQGFLDDTAELMALEQLQNSMVDTAFLTRRELNVHAGLLGQKRDLAYLPFDIDRFRSQVSIDDTEVERRYQENQRAYQTEERADAAYVSLALNDLLEDPAIEVSEEDILAAYESDKASAPQEEERRSRHILLTVDDERSDEEAAAELSALRERIEAGEAFEALAGEHSEDPGSAAQGGELGFAGRGVFDPAFEEALFALEAPGDLSDPVRSAFGYHLILLEEVRVNPYPPLEAQRAEIEQRLRRDQAAGLFAEKVRELDSLAFEHPNDLATIASQLGLTVEQAEGVTRAQGPAPFDDAAVREALFADDVLENGYNSAAVETGEDRAVVVRVAERHPAAPIPLEEVAEDIRYEIETERARTLAEEAHGDALQQLRDGAAAAAVAEAFDANWQTFQGMRRDASEVPRAILQAAFDLPRPASNGKSIGEAALPSGGLAVVTVTRVEDGGADQLSERDLEGMRAFLSNRVANQEFAALFETVRQEASIQRPE